MKKIIYTRADGGLTVLNPREGARLAFFVTLAGGERLPSAVAPFVAQAVDSIIRGWPVSGAVAEWAESEGAFVSRIAAKDVPLSATNVQIVDEAAVPADRTFRNAWRTTGAGIYCDMPAAKALARASLRRERSSRFVVLDGSWMRETACGNTAGAAAIEAKREVLRNWPQDPRIADAATPQALGAAIEQIKAESP